MNLVDQWMSRSNPMPGGKEKSDLLVGIVSRYLYVYVMYGSYRFNRMI
jgi:hypothetical protein